MSPLEQVLDQLAESLVERFVARLTDRIGSLGASRLPPVVEATVRRVVASERKARPRAKALPLPPAKKAERAPQRSPAEVEATISKIVETLRAHGSDGVTAAELRSLLGGADHFALARAKKKGLIRTEGSGRAVVYFAI